MSPNLDILTSSPSPSVSRQEQMVSPPFIPLDVVSLVVDKMVERRKPLGVVATEEDWRRAYTNDVAGFHAMSLVHPAWTSIARRGLRHRAIISYHQLNSFLLSPLCGPWITEMIIYWTVDNGTRGITPSDIDLFEALLRRIPNVHSLAFNTRLVSPSGWNTGKMPPLRADTCLELVSYLLPSLENLWLNQTRALNACREMGSLFVALPRMRSLKGLFLYGWVEDRVGTEVNWNEHPATNLRTLELIDGRMSSWALKWLIEPTNEFSLQSLSISIEQLQVIDYPLSNLKELRLYGNHMDLSNILEKYDRLVNLDLFVFGDLNLGDALLPKNLERITFYVPYVYLYILADHRLSDYVSLEEFRSLSKFVPLLKGHLSHLTCLRNLDIIGVHSVYGAWTMYQNPTVKRVTEDDIPVQLLDYCKEHGIDLSFGNASSAQPYYYDQLIHVPKPVRV